MSQSEFDKAGSMGSSEPNFFRFSTKSVLFASNLIQNLLKVNLCLPNFSQKLKSLPNQTVSWSIIQVMTKVFVKQPLALTGSAKNMLHLEHLEMLQVFNCPFRLK